MGAFCISVLLFVFCCFFGLVCLGGREERATISRDLPGAYVELLVGLH